MPYLSIIRGREDQGTPPQAMMDAMDVYVAHCLKEGTVVTFNVKQPVNVRS